MSIASVSTNRSSRHHPSTRLTRPRRHDRNPDFSKCGSTLGASVDVLCRNGRMVCVKEDGLPLSFETHQACHTRSEEPHVRTPVTNAHLVCRLLLEKNKQYQNRLHKTQIT